MVMVMMLSRTVLLVATLVTGTTNGFLVPSTSSSVVIGRTSSGTPTTTSTTTSKTTSKTKLNVDTTGWDSFKPTGNNNQEPSKSMAGEESRKFRRTVYTHDDWKKHRSSDRFAYYLQAIFKSGVYKNLGREVFATTGIATFVCVYNVLAGGATDFDGVQHASVLAGLFEDIPKLGLPLTPFTLASPSLGLLLVFRTNTSYQRWDEARKNWGMNINHTRDLVRMANTYYDSNGVSPEERQQDLNHLALCTWAFVRAMKRHLSPEEEDEENFQIELYEKLPPQQAQMIIEAAHRPNRALQDLSYAIDNLPMHFMRKNEIQRAVTIFEDDLGSSERLLTSPVPLFYSRHTARFVAVWLLLLPFALYDTFGASWNHIAMIPATAVLSVFLFGIEELATQLEEPFTILPMQAFCDKIYNWCTEIMTWQPGDNGRRVKLTKPEHAYFVSVAAPVQHQVEASAVVQEEQVVQEQVQQPVQQVEQQQQQYSYETVAPPPQEQQYAAPPQVAPPQVQQEQQQPQEAWSPAAPVEQMAEVEVPPPAKVQQRPAPALTFEDFLKNQK